MVRGGPLLKDRVAGYGEVWSVVALLALSSAALETMALAGRKAGEVLPSPPAKPRHFRWRKLGHALLCLVVAAALGAVLAFRPRAAGGPPRVAHVIQAQIMMAIVGSLVMLIVGASLARAFAIAGTAGLVRYRAKIDDPEDASVMLRAWPSALRPGVGLLYLAARRCRHSSWASCGSGMARALAGEVLRAQGLG